MRTVAVVTGATGQGGSYLCELLLEKDYYVKCLVRRSTYPIESSHLRGHLGEVSLYEGDVLDQSSIFKILSDCQQFDRIEVYNLAAQSHAGTSFDCPKFTFEVNTLSILNILETVRQLGMQNKCKIFQPSSSEMFGDTPENPQNESTLFNPKSLYGVSKLAAHYLIKNYREMYGLYASSGIMFNHESPRRSDKFVTQKIIKGLKSGKCFSIGNLESRRDWGHAKDYVRGIWMILQYKKSEDFVLSTGKNHSIEDFLKKVFKLVNLNWKDFVTTNNKHYLRPSEVRSLQGDSSKARKLLKWKPKYNLDVLCKDMLISDLKLHGMTLDEAKQIAKKLKKK